MSDPYNYSTILTALSVAGGLALGVERIIEFLKHLMEMETRSNQDSDKLAILKRAKELFKECKEIKKDIDKGTIVNSSPSRLCEYKNIDDIIKSPEAKKETPGTFADSESDEKYPAPGIAVISYKPRVPLEAGRMVFFQLAAAGLGIIFASFFDLHLMKYLLGDGLGIPSIIKYPLLDTVLSGIVIGGGSQPIHILIRFITKRKVSAEELQQSAAPADSAVAALMDKSNKVTSQQFRKEEVTEPLWKKIDYAGGINPASLDNKHVRTDNPNLIVFHHTAMSDKKTFRDIVNEFLVTKGWLTGYHCVIMPDGAIRPFCRWDRYGNHAKGKNMRSLGISFHGNFETRAIDKFSNADGRYGIQKPTDNQLRAGARIVALWTHLYDDIELDFEKCILPHREAMDNKNHTVCPGSNFPVKEFQDLVRYFYEGWDESEEIKAEIQVFSQKKYLKV